MRLPRFPPSPGIAASLGVHLAAVLLLGASLRFAVNHPTHILRLPGTPHGERTMLVYSMGGPAQPSISPTPAIAAPQTPPPPPVKTQPAALAAPAPVAPSLAEAGSGTAGASALGENDLHIALPQFHPRPAPDLSALAPGASGSVVVDIVIDTTGHVTGATLVKGLGGSIDKTVLSTLETWTFTPATKNGEVVASQQEVLIHYERSWAAPHIAPSPS